MLVANENDPLCPVKVYKLYVQKFFPPNYSGPFFLHCAYQKEMKKRGPNAHWGAGPMGKNHFNTVYKRIAERCNFTDKEKYTSRSARRSKITNLRSKNVAGNLLNAESRHAHTSTNELYQANHGEENDNLLRAKMFNPPTVVRIVVNFIVGY